MKKIIYSLLVCFFIIIGYGQNLLAYDNKYMHPIINENAGRQSIIDSALKNNLGFSAGIETIFSSSSNEKNTVWEWLSRGGLEEDEPSVRALNHFYDPLMTPWIEAGLYLCSSSMIWAQNTIGIKLNNSSWVKARETYLNALITGSESEYARTFLSLGQITHLLSDKALPAHVRFDIHPPPFWTDPYEDWAAGWAGDSTNKGNPIFTGIPIDPSIFSHYVVNNYAPAPISALWDQENYIMPTADPTVTKNIDPNFAEIGLAEYTNANFFSKDTIFKDYPHPAHEDTDIDQIDWLHPVIVDAEDGVIDSRIYIHAWVGGTDNIRLASTSYISYNCLQAGYHDFGAPVLDEEVHKDYASVLIPRAVGYSTALINYFFRGKIDIDDAIATYGADSSIIELTFAMKNTTPSLDENQTVEPFGPGTIELVYSYIMPDGTRHYDNTGTFYTIVDSTDLVNWEYITETVSLPEIIPAGAYELSFTLVFRGKLGNEEGAVAAQNYKFDNSRIAYFNQPGGRPNTSNIYTVSPDGSNPYQVTNAETPNPWYFSPS